jgi:TPR repeat protein
MFANQFDVLHAEDGFACAILYRDSMRLPTSRNRNVDARAPMVKRRRSRSRAAAAAVALLALVHAQAFFAHGRTLEFEAGVEAIEAHDYPRAVAFLRVAAIRGDARAQRVLGLMLLWGPTLYPGVAADPNEALMWMQHAADRGDEQAQWMVRRAWN